MHLNYFQLVLPLNLEVIIPEDDSVFLVEKVVKQMDLSILNKKAEQEENQSLKIKSKAGRKAKISKDRLLMILFYAYMEDIRSPRDISKYLKRDINFMYLAQGEKVSHTVINDFRNSLEDKYEALFTQFITYLYDLNEIELESIYIDGTKIEANANKYSFVWKKSIIKYEQKLQINVKDLLNTINEEFDFAFLIPEDEDVTVEQMEIVLKCLNKYVNDHKIEFKHGKGSRKTKVQRYIEELTDYISRQSSYIESYEILGNRNSYSKKDYDATFMRMKDDHMKNGQLKAGYNVQVGMEGEYVIGFDVVQDRNDINTLIPFLDHMYVLYGVRFKNVVADSGYASERNYNYLSKYKSNIYIPYQSYYNEQTKKFKNNISKRENMIYDEEKDVYICASAQELSLISIQEIEDEFNPIRIKKYGCKDCLGCKLKDKCMPNSKKETTNKTLTYSEGFEAYKKLVLHNIKTDLGIQFRINRSIQAEGFFGVLKQDYDFKRFTLRGLKGVKLEMFLMCMAYNLNKLHTNILNKTVGTVKFHKIKNDQEELSTEILQ